MREAATKKRRLNKTMADYVTVAEVKAAMPEAELGVSYDAMIGSIITAVSRSIDHTVGGQTDCFAAPNTASVRYYDGNGRTALWIDDALSINELAVDYGAGFDVIVPANYITYPYNETPVQRLMTWRAFPRTVRSIRVTAVFGYSTTPPPAIKQAALIQVIRLFMRSKQAFADSGASPEFGGVTVNFGAARDSDDIKDHDVRALLRPYMRRNGARDDD